MLKNINLIKEVQYMEELNEYKKSQIAGGTCNCRCWSNKDDFGSYNIGKVANWKECSVLCKKEESVYMHYCR